MTNTTGIIATVQTAKVQWKTLGEIATLFGGLTGKNKNHFANGNAHYIPYKAIFDDPEITHSTHLPTVHIDPRETQRPIAYGDVLFTGSSETPQEVGMSSVVMQHFADPVYLNSFCFAVRFADNIAIDPAFAKHLFRSDRMRQQICKTARGVTRFNVSKAQFKTLPIPLPPLPLQQEIAAILDKFSALTAQLTNQLSKEQTLRQQQYRYYRNLLLDFAHPDNPFALESGAVEWKELGEVATYSKNRIDAQNLHENNYIGVDNLLQNRAGKTFSKYVPQMGRLTKFEPNDILLGNIRPYLKKIWQADCIGGASGDVLVIHVIDHALDARFLYHLLSDDGFFSYNMQNAKGAKMPRGSKTAILSYKLPLPPLALQQEIVSILDKFHTLAHSLDSGLPREIALRQKQYRYYREKLLDFKGG